MKRNFKQKYGLSKNFKKFKQRTSQLFSKENQRSKKSKTLDLSIIMYYKYQMCSYQLLAAEIWQG